MTDQEMELIVARGGILHIIERARRACDLLAVQCEPGYKPRRRRSVPDHESVDELLKDIGNLAADVRKRLSAVGAAAQEG